MKTIRTPKPGEKIRILEEYKKVFKDDAKSVLTEYFWNGGLIKVLNVNLKFHELLISPPIHNDVENNEKEEHVGLLKCYKTFHSNKHPSIPMFEIVLEEEISDKHCKCDNPNLITNVVGGNTFLFCKKCRKEKI